MAARQLAAALVEGVLRRNRALNQLLTEEAARSEVAAMPSRDRALARLVAATVLRRQGELEYVLKAFLERPPPLSSGLLWPILLCGAAQLIFLAMPAHAVVDLAVEAVRRDRAAHRFAKLTNAVLRRVSEHGAEVLAGQDSTRLNIPTWLWQRWTSVYGESTARAIAAASLTEAPLDITLKPTEMMHVTSWAERLGGHVLTTGSIRLESPPRVEDLLGYSDGVWWVQDAAAALVARLAGDVAGRAVADLCAAPGGKTLQLAGAGGEVTAVDVSPARLERMRQNLQRLQLTAEIIETDVVQWAPGRRFDAVILDAPCSATGTIRRHPDVLRLRRPLDIARMATLQSAMLHNAGALVQPGGVLVYSTCSLEPEEGEAQIDAFLLAQPQFRRAAIAAAEIGGEADWITSAGDLRTLPFHLPRGASTSSGIDGFYAARLCRCG